MNSLANKLSPVLVLPPKDKHIVEGGNRTKGVIKKSLPNKPLITVITAVFNGQKYLEHAILSVINQSYGNVEYIIIDGGSTDDTLKILKKYNDKIDYWVSEKDNGIYDAWNKGLILALGDWISFLGADDLYLENALSKYSEVILTNKNIEYISSKVELFNEKHTIRIIGSEWCWNKFKRFMNVAHVGSLHSKSFFNKYGIYDLRFKIVGDYALLLKAKNKLLAFFVDEITAKMRTGGVSHINPYVHYETAKAKIYYGKRNKLIVYWEMLLAILKGKIRRLIWY